MSMNVPSDRWRHGRFLRERAPRILVADDDPDIRSELASALAEDGFLVVEAADGNELLDLVVRAVADSSARPFFDAIVTDVMMPGFSGLDVLTALRSRTARVPVLVITAFGDERTIRTAESLGAVAVFRKPFDLDDLRTALENALAHPEHMRRARGGHNGGTPTDGGQNGAAI
jgi:two-component system, response regulator, stage 0 sporulation protein F